MIYTLTDEGDSIVQKDIDKIKSVLEIHNVTSAVLFGSYGKGEGAIVNGRPTNDYDILIVDADDEGSINKDISVLQLGCKPECHFTTAQELKQVEPTQQMYEISRGHVLIHGIQPVFTRIEPYEIPYLDAVNSINRRIVSLLVAKYEMVKPNPDYRKISEQLAKAVIAVGDATLIRRGEFHHSYFVRALMLETDSIGEMYQMMVSIKVLGRPILDPDQLWASWNSVRNMVRTYCMENGVNPPYLDVLLSVTDDIETEELKSVLIQLGAGDWI